MGERLTADRLAEIEATLARRYPDVEDGDAICADCFASVRVHDGAEWSNGDSLCDGCAGSRLARTERALTDLLAEVRGLTAERDNLPRLWWVRDDAEEGACCYDAPTAAEAVAKALPDFGYEPDDDADLTVLPVTELHVSGLQDEVRTLRARVAELDEAARWRMLPERPKVGVRVDVALSPAGWRCSGAYAGGDLWVVSGQLVCTDADILGWRPLGPGPEVAGG